MKLRPGPGGRKVRPAGAGRRHPLAAPRQLAARKALAALLAALACVVLALALGEDEPGSEARQPASPRPWEAAAGSGQGAGQGSGRGSGLSSIVLPPLLADAGEAPRAVLPGPAPAVEQTAVAPAAERVPTPVPDSAAALTRASAAPVDGYRIQLGVFADPANALVLQQRLREQGLPGGVQSRVVLGPFPDRAAARAAQTALRAAGMEEGIMLLPPGQAAANKATGQKSTSDRKP